MNYEENRNIISIYIKAQPVLAKKHKRKEPERQLFQINRLDALKRGGGNLLKDLATSFYSKDKNIKFLFLGIFCLELTPVVLSVILILTAREVPVLLETAVSLLLFLTMLALVYVYLVKKVSVEKPAAWELKPATSEVDITVPAEKPALQAKLLDGFFSGLNAFLMVSTILFALYMAIKEAYRWIGISLSGKLYLYIPIMAALFVAIVLASLLVYSAVLLLTGSIRYGIPAGRQIKAFFYYIGVTFRRFLFSIFVLLSALLLFGLIIFILPYFTQLLQLSIHTAILRLVIKVVTVSAAETYMLYFLFNSAGKVIDRLPVRNYSGKAIDRLPVQNDTGKAGQPKSSFPLPLLTIILLVLAGALYYFNFPLSASPFDQIEQQAAIYDMQAETAYSTQMTDIAAIKAKKAYSLALSASGYLQGLIMQNNGTSDADKTAAAKFQENLDNSYLYDRTNVWTFIFKGYLAINSKDYYTAARIFEMALQGTESQPDIYFGALRSYIGSGDKVKAARMIELLVERQIYRGSVSAALSYSPGKLKDRLAKLEGVRKQLFENLALSAMEKMKYNDYQGMFNDIGELLKLEPDNKSLLYLYGVAAMSYRSENTNYELAKTTYNRLLEVSGKDEASSLLAGYMSILTKDYANSKSILKDLYEKYPGNAGVGEQYAYSLIVNKDYSGAINVADDILSKNPESWFSEYVKAVARLNMNQFPDSLKDIEKLLQITKKESLKELYDQYLYSYSLAYSLTTKQQDSMDALGKLDQSGILYNFITGTTAWRDKDYDKAEQYLKKTITLDGSLAYPDYLIGNVYYERTMIKKTNEHDSAEKYYLSSLKKLPGNATCWFALAHNYKKWGSHEVEALRAFRKVVDLMPYSDHTWDYYGMTIHSQQEISALSSFEK